MGFRLSTIELQKGVTRGWPIPTTESTTEAHGPLRIARLKKPENARENRGSANNQSQKARRTLSSGRQMWGSVRCTRPNRRGDGSSKVAENSAKTNFRIGRYGCTGPAPQRLARWRSTNLDNTHQTSGPRRIPRASIGQGFSVLAWRPKTIETARTRKRNAHATRTD